MGDKATTTVAVWLRKSLRVHDNPALQHACNQLKAKQMIVVFCLDPHFYQSAQIGIRRWQFLCVHFVSRVDPLIKRFLTRKKSPTRAVWTRCKMSKSSWNATLAKRC